MEQRKSYQLYLLEGEQQIAEFEYENAYRADESIQRRMNDYKFYLRMSLLYALLVVVFMFGVNVIGYISGGSNLLLIIIPVIFLMCLISAILWLGMVWKSIKFGISYGKLKERKEKAELSLFSASQRLLGIQMKISELQKEIALEEKEREKEQLEKNPEKERESLVCKQDALNYRIERLKKEYKEEESELHRLLKEEYENEREKKRYAKLTIAGVIVLIIFAVIQGLRISIFSTIASQVVVLVMPWCIIIPYSIGWLSKAMNTFWGDDLWINRFVFREMQDYSIAGRIQKCRENMEQLKEKISVVEKEKVEIVKKLY